MAAPELKTFYPKKRKAWRKWLEKNHAESPGIWLIYFKKSSGKPGVEYYEAVEEALCFGWIDSTLRSVDEKSFMQRFTPRKAKSNWSALNKSRVKKLIKEGSMTQAGLEKIKIAKKNNSWKNLDHVENLEIPSDLEKVFSKNKAAWQHFQSLRKFRKKQLLYSLGLAKLPETRKRRIDEILAQTANVKRQT